MTRPPDGTPTAAAQEYPGQRLGLPEEGPGSVASWLRRILALLVDWIACRLVVGVVAGPAVWTTGGSQELWVFGLFIVESAVLIALVGGSFGHLVARMAVVRLDRRPVNVLLAVLRTVLICLVIPPLVFNRDQRGLHDLAVGTVTLRR